MAKGKGKVSGFLTAVILAVVSFFVVFTFFPRFSEKYLGMSFGNKGAEISEAVKDKSASALDAMTDAVIKKTVSK